ncbi:MrcB family domain-containing protein [Paenibacillus sp. R14(2021)]|uniref:MrcB family domain-containing protein n=1 Tax=Paenibacillus sp. R14(2021) TaxID=2859228 RepID=UPI001C613BC3|nr:DUF3578 domain-containing protein [Paenibacillus sp. R14(2021)]
MTLPVELASIFRAKQKSYKMVLILCIIEEYKQTKLQFLPLSTVAERFLSYYQSSNEEGQTVDTPPANVADSWGAFTLTQTKSLLKTPIDALSAVLETTGDSITFKTSIWSVLDEAMLQELAEYAQTQLDAYNEQLAVQFNFSLKETFDHVLDNYLTFKTQPFANHSVGALVRNRIPEYLRSLDFIDSEYKVQGSIGQGNWVGIPWIAILDKRLNMTIQRGEYIVYLFAEDMSAVYLTLIQGVTEPLQRLKKKRAYPYFKQKSEEIRAILPLENLQLDDLVPGIGDDYQAAIIASVRYERGQVPNDAQLLADLKNVVHNYKLYAEIVAQKSPPTELPVFKYTIAHLYLTQGIINYLGQYPNQFTSLEELIAHPGVIFKTGDEIKNPKERAQHLGRAIQELGLITIEDNQYALTSLGWNYFQGFDLQIWQLSANQAELLRNYFSEEVAHDQASNLIKVMNLAIALCEELENFTLVQFNEPFIAAMGMEESWSTVTQESRSRFMLNWLEELQYLRKSGDMYTYEQPIKEEPVDNLSVMERIEAIKVFIRGKGFHFPQGLIENFYLSLKTKPFAILAGVSGTGKTKLVKLFAEALGATSSSGQFTLIPVRPDWSDPSDLLGYKDLTGAFRPGKLAEVLAVAAQERNRHKPYFICLDEMNLARVEHYFSDLLSVIETQEWREERIVTVPLIEAKSLAPEDQPLYGGLALPDNVYLIGTVNMDETTHPFSKKVLDRANTIEFNYINLEQFPDLVGSQVEEAGGRAPNAFLRSEFLQLIDAYAQHEELAKRVTAQLVRVNGILEQVHSHVGFRIRDAVCFYMIYNEQFELMGEDEAFDLQLLQKILPRVQGSSSSVKRVLLQLMQVALGRNLPLQDYLDNASELYMKWSSWSASEEKAKYPFSARKLAFMLRRLEEDGFTSYWLS